MLPRGGSQGPGCPLAPGVPLRILLQALLNLLVSKSHAPCAGDKKLIILSDYYCLPFCANLGGICNCASHLPYH